MKVFTHLLLAFIVGAFANELVTKHQVRDNQMAGATEITGTVSGAIEGYGHRLYYLNLAANEVVDVSIVYDEYFAGVFGSVYIYLGGTESVWALSGNTPDPVTISGYCPVNSAKLYFDIAVNQHTPANFTLTLAKKSALVPAGQSSYSHNVTFTDYGYIGYPISVPASQCQRTTFQFNFLEPVPTYYIDLSYMCRNYNYECEQANIPSQAIYAATSDNIVQYMVNCTATGNYYLYLYASKPRLFTATIHNGYPCPDNCWLGGYCNFDTGSCVCNLGFSGANCSRSSTPVVTNNTYTILNLPVDGSKFTFTKAMQQVVNTNLKLDFTPTNGSVVKVTFTVPSGNLGTTVYYNPVSVAGSAVYVSRTFLNGAAPKRIEVYICASVGPWYLYVRSTSDSVTQDMTITAEMVDASIGNSLTLSGTATTSIAASVVNVFSWQPQGTYTNVQLNQTSSKVSGIYLYTACTVYQDFSTGSNQLTYAAGDTGNYARFQVGTTSGSTVYLVVSSVPNTTFAGTITYNATSGCPYDLYNGGYCGGRNFGFCSSSSVCMCRQGYKGVNCTEVDFPAGSPVLKNNVPQTITLSSTPGSMVYVTLPAVPAGSFLKLRIQSTSAYGSIYSDGKLFPFATSNPIQQITPGMDQYITFDSCVERTASQTYFSVGLQKSFAGGDITFTAVLGKPTLFINGTSTNITASLGYNGLIAYLPAKCTNAAYYVTVEGSSDINVVVGYGKDQCLEEYYSLNADANGTYSTILSIVNCTEAYAIDLRLYAYANDTVRITISPTTPCPNNCNGDAGTCLLGGVCKCKYPYIGNDCGTLDAQCTVLNDAGVCHTNVLSSITNNFNDPQYYCALQSASISATSGVQDTTETLCSAGVSLTADCKSELQQILCDSTKYKCASQSGGGIKFMLPCNALTWQSRCAPAYNNDISVLYNPISNIQDLQAQYPALYICNPSPYTPGSGNYTNSVCVADSTSSSGSSSGQSGPSSSSTTSSNTNGANGVVASIFVIAFFAVMLLM